MDKKKLTEQDIRTKFITPAIVNAGWDVDRQVREEVFFTDGKIEVRGESVQRGQGKKSDYILFYKANLPIAIIEGNKRSVALGNLNKLVGLKVYIGISPAIRHYIWSRHTYS